MLTTTEELTTTGQAERAGASLHPVVFYTIALLVVAADQWSKSWVQHTLGDNEARPIFGTIFSLRLTQNHGGAWGILPQGNMVFALFATFAIIALLTAYHRMARIGVPVGGALALALGGALGNLVDRIRFHWVVDFFDFHVGKFYWPIFNVADSAISVGICLLLYHFVRSGGSDAESGRGRPMRG